MFSLLRSISGDCHIVLADWGDTYMGFPFGSTSYSRAFHFPLCVFAAGYSSPYYSSDSVYGGSGTYHHIGNCRDQHDIDNIVPELDVGPPFGAVRTIGVPKNWG